MSPEELRRAAMEALGQHADERARDALAHAAVAMATAPQSTKWPIYVGYRVTLAVDAATLGVLRGAPATIDALGAAVAAAVAATPGEKLVDLALRWVPAARPSSATYRDAPPVAPETALCDALRAYLGGAGYHALAAALAGAEVDASDAGEVTVRLPRATYDALQADAYGMAHLTSALRDLLARDDARVRLRQRA
jgi:hypothetical protein